MPRPARRSPRFHGNSASPLAVALAMLLAACQREPAPPPGGTLPLPEPTRALVLAPPPPTLLPPPSSALVTAPSPPSSIAVPPPERPFTLVELAPTEGDLTPLVQTHVARARAQGLKPFVEFYADWCAPCQAVHRSLDDPRMIDAFRGTYVLRLNVDDWKEKLPGTGFVPREIPVFYAVNTGGRPTGRSLQGLAWGRSVPENMAPKLKAFFGG